MCDSTAPRKRKPKWNTPHSTITIEDAGDKLGFRVITLEDLEAPVRNFLKDAEGLKGAEYTLLKTKKRVNKRIQDHLVAGGYHSEADLDFKEANVNDMVYAKIVPIIADFSTRRHNTLVLHRRSQLAATDFSAGGYEEFVIDWISPVFPEVQSVCLRGKTGRTMGRSPPFFG